MLDRFAFEVFLSVYIFSPSITRMPKFRLLTKRDPTLGYTREADEGVNAPQVDFSFTRRGKLKQFRFVRLMFKINLKSQSLRSRPWLIPLFIL